MDPFSITASVVTLIQVSAQVTVLVKQFRDEVNVVDTTLNGILNDVDGFQQVLQSMKETFAQEDIQAEVQTTGHVGSHWKNLARSLSDGEGTLDQLRSLLTSVSKSTSFLDATRKQLRLKSAIAQISGFREQIQSYRAALQLSLSTVIVWNQVTLQKSTAKLPERVIPNLNKLYDEIRNLGADLNAKIEKLQSTVVNQGFHAESELISLTNLKECVESAADVVSTASTTLGPEGSDKASAKYGSDFGDVFKKESNETMQRWMSSNTVYEFDDVEAPTLDPSETSTGDALTVYESDSDSDIENELVRALFNNGKRRKEQGDLHGAERHLRNCLSRFPSTTSYTSLASSQSTSITGVSKAELLEMLTETYCLQGSWTQAKSTMKEKLAITERQTGKKSESFLWDSFTLCEILLNTKDYTEAHIHGRQSLRGFRKLREPGHDGYEKTLVLLIKICKEQENLEDEEAYAALLGSYRGNLATQQSTPGTKSNTPQDLASPLTDAHPQDLTFAVTTKYIASDVSLPSSRRMSGKPKSPERWEPSSSIDPKLGTSLNRANTTHSDEQSPSSMLGKLTTKLPDARGGLSMENAAAQEFVVSTPNGCALTGGETKPQTAKLTPGLSLATPDNHTSRADVLTRSLEAARSSFKGPPEGDIAIKPTNETLSSSATRISSKATPQLQSTLPSAHSPDSGDTSSYTKLLVALCQQELGSKPVFMIGRGREGYNCMVFADSSQRREIAKVTGCKTREEARHNAASKAYKALVLLSTQSRPTTSTNNTTEEVPVLAPNTEPPAAPREGHVDPPAYTPNEAPSNLSSPVEFLQSIPEIMVSPTLNQTTFLRSMACDPAQSFPVRRAASDSRLPWHKNTNAEPFSNHTKLHTESFGGLHGATANPDLPTHRRAASTSTRLPDWKTGEATGFSHPSKLMVPRPALKSPHGSDDSRKRPTAQPSVTFDTIEGSVERSNHSNPDPVTPTSRSFSLFPTSMAKTFSLQDRRSKSDDPSLTKKKSLRFALLGSSSKRKSPTTASPASEATGTPPASSSIRSCPICTASLHDLSDDEAWSHVDSCLGESSPQITNTAYELPASEPSFFAAELPAPFTPPTPSGSRVGGPNLPSSPIQSPSAMSDLHRAFSRRDLSADKFEIEDEVNVAVPPAMSPLSRFELNPLQRQVLLLGDAKCGKTWLSSAWCNGVIPKHTPSSATTFTKPMGSLEVVVQDHSEVDFFRDHLRHASYGVVHAVLLCFDISSPESFDNVEHKWNHEADLYLNKVPKILVGCKKDINRGGSRTVWTRDAYKLTARISARAYFETSAVTMEGLDMLFNHVAQIAPR
ncbi:hypothetical protein ST47_g7816 [Ascochyta rabiei]|uniref:Azaphilone pigments biosynthesis cluster protein L N-terminal domain-containing protein n=1 Tax=Didymella rabiei TaxID=5454 RepID=A0A163A683_DIDRA|nr:hypothetical protein ST47_g7816 [Ascochyta rabiei]